MTFADLFFGVDEPVDDIEYVNDEEPLTPEERAENVENMRLDLQGLSALPPLPEEFIATFDDIYAQAKEAGASDRQATLLVLTLQIQPMLPWDQAATNAVLIWAAETPEDVPADEPAAPEETPEEEPEEEAPEAPAEA